MDIGSFLLSIVDLIDFFVVPFIFGIAFVVFLWGIFVYFIQGGADEEKRKEGRTFILYGLSGFVIMISIWGIVWMLYYTLGFRNEVRPPLPLFGADGGGDGDGGFNPDGGLGGDGGFNPDGGLGGDNGFNPGGGFGNGTTI